MWDEREKEKREGERRENKEGERGASAVLATVPLATQSVWIGRRPALLTY